MPQATPTSALTALYYLPHLSYFAYLLPYSTLRVVKNKEHKQKNMHNRCSILTSQGVHRLTIPIHQSTKYTKLYPYLAIDNTQSWAKRHWRTLCTAYSRAPYFIYFSDYFHPIFQHQYTYLFELNLALLRTCLELLQLKKEIIFSTSDKTGVASTHGPTDLYHQTLHSVGPHTIVPYPQVFGSRFYANLSIVDLLFCQGPESITILKQLNKQILTQPRKYHVIN